MVIVIGLKSLFYRVSKGIWQVAFLIAISYNFYLPKTVEAEKLSKKFNKGIYFERINASGNLKSASNVKNEKEIGFTN
jgi:hypothetical protein